MGVLRRLHRKKEFQTTDFKTELTKITSAFTDAISHADPKEYRIVFNAANESWKEKVIELNRDKRRIVTGKSTGFEFWVYSYLKIAKKHRKTLDTETTLLVNAVRKSMPFRLKLKFLFKTN